MLYLIVSPSCLSQMEIPYLLNNSPDFFGEQPQDAHWAKYQLNDQEVDGETGVFGTVRVHDDYWNIDDEDRQYYNFNVRNSMHLSREDFQGLLHFIPKYKNIALLLHATNIQDIFAWSLEHRITVIGAYMGEWRNDLEYWAMREYNSIMEDDANANYSQEDHNFPGIAGVVDAFQQKQRADEAWYNKLLGNCNAPMEQEDWQRLERIPYIYDRFSITSPSQRWIQDYFKTFQSRQQYNIETLTQLRMEYARRK